MIVLIMMIMKKFLLSLLALLLLALPSAFAQDLVNGTEVILTNLGSETIVGHGKVDGKTLELTLTDETGGFFLYFIFPDGQVASHQGQITPELVGVFSDAGELLDITAVLAARGGIQLNVVRADNAPNPSDDGALEQPGG